MMDDFGVKLDERHETVLGASDRQFRLWVDRQFRHYDAQLEQGQVQFKALQDSIDHNTLISAKAAEQAKATADNTSELVTIFSTTKTSLNGFKVVAKWLWKLAKPILILGAILGAIKHGDWKAILEIFTKG